MKQPTLGITSLLLVIIMSFLVISLFDESTFGSWVTYLFMCCVPGQMVMTLLWKTRYPIFLTDMPQPSKGFSMLAMMLVVASALALFGLYFVGGWQTPTPPLVMYSIVSIVITFWFVPLLKCWPISNFTRNPAILGVATLLIATLGAYAISQSLFNFDFLKGSPAYIPALDPKGPISAWDIVVPGVTSVAVILMLVLFDFWPIAKFTGNTKAVFSLSLVATLSYVIFTIATTVFNTDPVVYMVFGSIAFIFGAFLPLNLLQGSLFNGIPQPLKGAMLSVFCLLAGLMLQVLYVYVAPSLTSHMPFGAPNYAQELWLANALLAVTFTILVAFTEFFGHWPLVNLSK